MIKKAIFIVIIMIFLISCSRNEILDNPEEECSRIGKTWETFSNGCVDSCSKERDENQGCSSMLEEGCNCGPEQCWNGKTCEPN